MIDQYPLGPDMGKPEAITQTAGISAGRREGNFWLIARERRHTAVVIHCSSFCFGAAPIWREAI